MSVKIKQFKAALGVGARSNKYRIMLGARIGATNDIQIDELCKSTELPEKTVGTIETFTQGRRLPVIGDSAYGETLSLTFWLTEGHEIRDQFDTWMEYIDSVNSHSRGGSTSLEDYTTDGAKLQQLSTVDNSVTATYSFYDMWPSSISGATFDDSAQDTIQEFTVDFAFSYYERV